MKLLNMLSPATKIIWLLMYLYCSLQIRSGHCWKLQNFEAKRRHIHRGSFNSMGTRIPCQWTTAIYTIGYYGKAVPFLQASVCVGPLGGGRIGPTGTVFAGPRYDSSVYFGFVASFVLMYTSLHANCFSTIIALQGILMKDSIAQIKFSSPNRLFYTCIRLKHGIGADQDF